MKELDLLKKDWNKQNADYPKLTYNEIYALIQKKSSSIVRFIFIICIAEFLFWGLINLFVPDSIFEIYEKLNLKTVLTVSYILNYIIVVIFIYLFYKNYKAISVTDTTKLLMEKIIKTRKTVKYYVYINILLAAFFSIILNYSMFIHGFRTMEDGSITITSDETSFNYKALILRILAFILSIFFIWVYYLIIYGILLRKLKKNYKELEILE